MTLSVYDLGFAYKRHAVLEDIGFELHSGEMMALLGVNGAGKSTLLKCLNRILSPQSGRIAVAEKAVSTMTHAELACHFGYVPQQAGEETLTVFDAVLLGRRPHIKWTATERDLEIVENVLQLMNLSRFALRPANQLSGGELQKVLIARALAQEPRVLLLDEPTSNLDLKNQIQVMDLVANAVREKGIAALISVHDINLALRYADRFLMLKEGRIHCLSTEDQITPELIREVYSIEAVVNRVNNRTVVVPMEAC